MLLREEDCTGREICFKGRNVQNGISKCDSNPSDEDGNDYSRHLHSSVEYRLDITVSR